LDEDISSGVKCACDLINFSSQELLANQEFRKEIADIIAQPGVPESISFILGMAKERSLDATDIVGIFTLAIYLYKSNKKFNELIK
jgi:hypothetical protein